VYICAIATIPIGVDREHYLSLAKTLTPCSCFAFIKFHIHARRFCIRINIEDCFIIIISLLISLQLGHRPSLQITHKESGPQPTTRAKCGLVGANDCKCSRDQRLNVPSKARRICFINVSNYNVCFCILLFIPNFNLKFLHIYRIILLWCYTT
jgi:hypothetical protein